MNLIHYLIPTPKNGYRPWFTGTPALMLMLTGIILFNSFFAAAPLAAATNITVQNLLTAHNHEREVRGLGTLELNAALTNSAQAKAQKMLELNCWSHFCPEGTSPWVYFDQAGYEYIYAGENLAEGFDNVEDAIAAWLASPTHMENMLKPEYTQVGFGIVSGDFQDKQDNIIVAAHFGSPYDSAAEGPMVISQSTLPTPTITSPVDGTITNHNFVDVAGQAPSAQQVEIKNFGSTWLTVDADQGIFTTRLNSLEDQAYQISAQSWSGANSSAESATVDFIVDTTPELIGGSELLVTSRDSNGVLSIQLNHAGLSAASAVVNGSSLEFKQQSDQIWQVLAAQTLFEQHTTFEIVATDAAGNIGSSLVQSSVVLQQAAQLPVSFGQGQVIGVNTKAQVNIVFLVALGLLFGTDYLALAKTGITKTGGKTQLHFALLIIVGIIALMGTFAGQILQGISR